MRGGDAQRIGCHEMEGLVSVHWLQFEVHEALRAEEAGPKVVGVAGVGMEVGELGEGADGEGMQDGAHVMVSGKHGSGEVRIGVDCAGPCAIESHAGSRISEIDGRTRLLDEVDQRFTGQRRRGSRRVPVQMDVQRDVCGAAGGCGGVGGLLGEGRGGEAQSEEDELHGLLRRWVAGW